MNVYSIIESAKRLASFGENTRFAVKMGGEYYTTVADADLNDLGEEDIVAYDLDPDGVAAIIFKARPDVAAVVFSAPDYIAVLAEKDIVVPPILDDFAQIVGPTLRVNKDISILKHMIRGRNACMIEGNGIVTCGRTLDEAATALLVAEKTAKTYILAKGLGGAKPIPMWEAVLMNYVYRKKYSKKDQDAKVKE